VQSTLKGTDMTEQQPILLIGGNGKTGRRVAERLRARHLPVRIGSRSGEPPFDWEDRSTWAPALRGTSAAYVTATPASPTACARRSGGRRATSPRTRATSPRPPL
jgi:uncharacterized protein YbjT (DUF2867 family)